VRRGERQFADFDDEPVFDRIAGIAKIHAERLAEIRRSSAVGDIRQIGTIAALELRTDDAGYLSAMRPKLYRFFLERGVLLRPLGNVVYVLPPYVIAQDELHRVYDVIVEAYNLAWSCEQAVPQKAALHQVARSRNGLDAN
jgi:adenosylmethionine-8-amino-7-oxononanoate aminotransferase